MSNLDYKEGRGDYYLAAGRREEKIGEQPSLPQLLADLTIENQALRRRIETLSVHEHDPDQCDECLEMVMEALRD